VQQRLPSLLDEPIAFGHRGARAYAADNTLESFELALTLGANGLESDVWLTADGEAVLDHDGIVPRRFGRTATIATVDRAQLPAHIPSLDDLLECVGGNLHLSLDLKDPAAGQVVVDTVARFDAGLLERTWLCSPDWRSLLPLRGQGVRLIDSTRLVRIKEGPERRAATLAREGIDGINLHHSDWSGGLVALFHRFERVAFGWDMNHDNVMATGLRMGLDAVYCDSPDKMVDVYRAHLGAVRRPLPGS
jgi:glycerophosphoryl diester phosphodiesterase